MRRTITHTQKIKLPKDKIDIGIQKDDSGKINSFKISIGLNGLDLQQDNNVMVEAYHRSEVERFELGTVQEIGEAAPTTTEIGPIGLVGDSLKFRVIIVKDGGEIVSMAEGIKPNSDISEPLLPVKLREIGRKVWEIRYEGVNGAPELVVNSKIPSIKSVARSDYRFVLGIYPNVLRSVLERIVYYEDEGLVKDVDRSWVKKWLRFSDEMTGSELPDDLQPKNNEQTAELEKWINASVRGFTESRDSEWHKMVQGW